jgi:integrase
MSWIFGYAEREEYIQQDQNPLYIKFDWETGTKRRVSDKTFADTITSKSWGMLPEFLKTVNENECNGSKVTDLATKAHLLMCIRTGVIVSLEWDWYDAEKDQWVIPPDVGGLKNKRLQLESGSCESHIIPSTPEINRLMNKARKLNGWNKYCFPSLGGQNNSHLGAETINDHFKNLGWKDKQSAHQWRSVITTAGKEHGFDYEVIDRQLGRKEHLKGTRGHYDRSTLLEKRKEFMKWWSKTLVEQGLRV